MWRRAAVQRPWHLPHEEGFTGVGVWAVVLDECWGMWLVLCWVGGAYYVDERGVYPKKNEPGEMFTLMLLLQAGGGYGSWQIFTPSELPLPSIHLTPLPLLRLLPSQPPAAHRTREAFSGIPVAAHWPLDFFAQELEPKKARLSKVGRRQGLVVMPLAIGSYRLS